MPRPYFWPDDRRPWPVAVFGLLIALLCGYWGVGAWPDVQRYKPGPRDLSLADAVAASRSTDVYARVRNFTLDCPHAFHDSGKYAHTFVPVRDDGAVVVAVADYSGKIDCSQLSKSRLTGVFLPLWPGLRDRLIVAGMQIGPDTRQVCTSCGLEDSRLSVLLSSVLAVLALLLYPAARLDQKRQKRVPLSHIIIEHPSD